MDPPATGSVAAATEYCDALVLDGHDDWRLPPIDELRTLIRGCPNTQSGGACAASESCTSVHECYGCVACDPLQGPGPGGCYWGDQLPSDYCGSYWSSTPQTDQTDPNWKASWDIELNQASVGWTWSYLASYFRCVRGS